MYTEIQRFTQWLRCKSPHTSTHVHYGNDLKLFFAWANKPPAAITISDVDNYITDCQTQGHAIATINRRLAALRSFYHFLATHTEYPPANPVIPKRHFIKQGRRLPRDVGDNVHLFPNWNLGTSLLRNEILITVPFSGALKCPATTGNLFQQVKYRF